MLSSPTHDSEAHVVHTTANKPFHVVETTRTSAQCLKIKNARAKQAKQLFFDHRQIFNFVTFLLTSSSWLLELPNDVLATVVK